MGTRMLTLAQEQAARFDESGVVLASVGTGGASGWIRENIIPLAILVVGVIALFRGRKGDFAGVATIGACAVVGLAIVAMAMPGVAEAVGGWIVDLFVTR